MAGIGTDRQVQGMWRKAASEGDSKVFAQTEKKGGSKHRQSKGGKHCQIRLYMYGWN